MKDRKCLRCGGIKEYIITRHLIGDVYYCADCKIETHVTHEAIGPEEKLVEKLGE